MAKTTKETEYNKDLVKLGQEYFDKVENTRAYPMKAIGAFLGIDVGSPQSKGAQEWMKNLIVDKITQSGMLSGDVNYQDYDPRSSKGFPSREAFPFTQSGPGSPQTMYQNTLGRGEFAVPESGGQVKWSPRSTQYDFDLPGFDITNKGGILGMLSNKITGGPPKLQHYVPDVRVTAKDIRGAFAKGMMTGTKVARDISNITKRKVRYDDEPNRDTGVNNRKNLARASTKKLGTKPARASSKLAKAVSSRKPAVRAGRLDNPYA